MSDKFRDAGGMCSLRKVQCDNLHLPQFDQDCEEHIEDIHHRDTGHQCALFDRLN